MLVFLDALVFCPSLLYHIYTYIYSPKHVGYIRRKTVSSDDNTLISFCGNGKEKK